MDRFVGHLFFIHYYHKLYPRELFIVTLLEDVPNCDRCTQLPAPTAALPHRLIACSIAEAAARKRWPSSLSVRAVLMHCEVAWPIDSRMRFIESVTNSTPCDDGVCILVAKAAVLLAAKPEELAAAIAFASASTS